MKIKARNYLFILRKKATDRYCHQCTTQLLKGDLTYSKRHEKYYCKNCAFKLGFIDQKLVRELMNTVS